MIPRIFVVTVRVMIIFSTSSGVDKYLFGIERSIINYYFCAALDTVSKFGLLLRLAYSNSSVADNRERLVVLGRPP